MKLGPNHRLMLGRLPMASKMGGRPSSAADCSRPPSCIKVNSRTVRVEQSMVVTSLIHVCRAYRSNSSLNFTNKTDVQDYDDE